MTRSRMLAVALAAGMLGLGGVLGAPAAAAPTQAPGCDIGDATLSWGFKESFRAYIDGDIANGEWTTSGGATYETPEFTWSGGTGRFYSDTGSGFVQFAGSVRFTGHDGLLDTTITDPVVTLSGEMGTLTLDVAGPSMDGEQIDAQGVPFVELFDLELSGEDALVTIDAATVLTDEGEAAFPDYQAGTDFDPVSLAMPTSGDCAAGFDGGDAIDTEDDLPTLLFGFIGFLIVAGAVVTTILVLRRQGR